MSPVAGGPQPQTAIGPTPAELLAFTAAIHGDQRGFLGLLSGQRVAGQKKLLDVTSKFYAYPVTVSSAATWIGQEVAAGREVYLCANLLTDRRRVQQNAAPVASLWADVDHDHLPDWLPAPTLTVESSPGRWQCYWRLSEPAAPAVAEALNHRLADAISADAGGWDLGQLLRPPSTPNHKYPGRPATRVVTHDATRVYDAADFDRLLPPAAEPKASANGHGPTPHDAAGGDMPPVRLDADALAVWCGERPALQVDGTIDKSETLWKIGATLYEANATGPTIAAALAERDVTLNYNRYLTVPHEYQRIATKLEAKQHPPRRAVGAAEEDDPCDDVRDQVGELRTKVAYLSRELNDANRTIATLRERVAMADEQLAIHTNPKLGAPRAAGAALSVLFRSMTPVAPDKLPAELKEKRACYRVPLGKLADATNLSADALSRQTEALAGFTDAEGHPVLYREVIDVREHVDPETGEIIYPHKELWLGPGRDPTVFGGVLARLAPKERKAWGGRADRNSCPDHPDAGTVQRVQRLKRTRVECAACRRLLIETIEHAGDEQVTHAPAPTPHDAASVNTPSYCGSNRSPSKMRHGSSPPEPAYMAASFHIPVDHAPPDHYTDPSLGRAP